MAPALKPGHVYRLHTLTPPQRRVREWVLTYLGSNRNGGLDFSGRPYFGTTTMPPGDIVDAWDLGVPDGIDLGTGDSRHHVGKVVR